MNEHMKIFYFTAAIVISVITISSLSYFNYLANGEATILPYTSSDEDTFRIVSIYQNTLNRDIVRTMQFMSNANFIFIGNTDEGHMLFERSN